MNKYVLQIIIGVGDRYYKVYHQSIDKHRIITDFIKANLYLYVGFILVIM